MSEKAATQANAGIAWRCRCLQKNLLYFPHKPATVSFAPFPVGRIADTTLRVDNLHVFNQWVFWDLDFEPVIVSLLSCHYSQMFQSEIITLFSKSSTQWICLHHFLHIPPSLNNYPYWTAASSTFHSRTFSNLRVAVMLQRWFCRLKFCLNPMDTYYFAYLSLTSTQLYILAMTFWARVRCGSKHHLIFCLQSSCRNIFRSSKIFFGDVSYHFGESQLCASFLWQGIQPST